MIQYPIHFKSESQAGNGLQTTWEINSGDYNLTCAIPPEFEGAGGGLSPEDLFAQALTNCFVATFKVYAHHSRLDFEKVMADSTLTVDLGADGKPVMKKLHLQAKIQTTNPAKAKTLAERAFKQGFILNSVKTELVFDLEIVDTTTAVQL
jgi:organic hydroperoxide reductase OsmC/OhrA